MFAHIKAVLCTWRTGTVKIIPLGHQNWVPVKAMETCHGLHSLGLGSCFPIVCSTHVKPCFKKANGKTPTDCNESEVWPLVCSKSSVKPRGRSSLRLLQGWHALLGLAHTPPLHASSSSKFTGLCGKGPTSYCMLHLSHQSTFNHSDSQLRRKWPCCRYINQRNYWLPMFSFWYRLHKCCWWWQSSADWCKWRAPLSEEASVGSLLEWDSKIVNETQNTDHSQSYPRRNPLLPLLWILQYYTDKLAVRITVYLLLWKSLALTLRQK